MIKQIIFYILLYIYKIWKIIFYIDKKFLDIIANPVSDQPSNFPPGGNLKVDPHNAAPLKFMVKVRLMFPIPLLLRLYL